MIELQYLFPKNYNKKKCINCGIYGHTIKLCNSPITSYGIIAYTILNNEIKYMMIQRKNSLTYIEFIRGKYSLNNVNYIEYLFENMTIEERLSIKENNIESLWKILWTGNLSNKLQQEFKDSKIKYYKLFNGYLLKKNNDTKEFTNLNQIIDKINIKFPNRIDTEWEFPKGRRNLNESDIDCAFREFNEETGVDTKKIHLCNFIKKPIEEIYISDNKTRYKHVYYIGYHYHAVNEELSLFNKDNKTQCKEVKDVKWMTYEEILNIIRYNYIQRTEMLKRIHKQLLNHISL